MPVDAHCADEPTTCAASTMRELAAVERLVQRAPADALMRCRRDARRSGAHRRPRHARCGADVCIDVGCVFEGDVVLGDGVRVGRTAC